jgi:pimeloyl-ACP methyl ester carboxylesterase
VEPPRIRYARSGDVAIAYQVVGEGPVDLVFVPLNLSIVFSWEQPIVARFYERLASFSRLILLDKRGTGISDRPRALPTLESQMDDVRAVLDAVGSEQAALFGSMHGAQMCALFAATYPDRTSALVLYNAATRATGTPDERRAWLRSIREDWGSDEWIEQSVQANYPSCAGDEDFRRWYARGTRISASPGSAYDFIRTFVESDITDVLGAIRIPTLVMYRRDVDPAAWSVIDLEEQASFLASGIPNARVVPIEGRDIGPYVGPEVADEVERFLTDPEARYVPDRVLTTVMFGDIVESTARATSLGDRGWSELLTAHRDRFEQSSPGSGERRSTLRATGSSPRSTGRHARSSAPGRSSPRPVRPDSSSAPVSIPGTASWSTERSRVWPSTSAHGWPARPTPEKSSSRGR